MHDVMRDLGVMVQSQGESVGMVNLSTDECEDALSVPHDIV